MAPTSLLRSGPLWSMDAYEWSGGEKRSAPDCASQRSGPLWSMDAYEWSGGEKRSAPDCASQRSRACALVGAFSSDVDEVGARDRLP